MLPRRILDSIETPEGRTLALVQRGGVFFLDMSGEELMSSRMSGSEEALAREVVARMSTRRGPPRLLVGGLGMGFTLRATLDALTEQPEARVEVAEVFDAVVAWNRGPLADLAREPLADPRVSVRVEDVALTIGQGPGRYDAILLDVDNGPDPFTLASNDQLYTAEGLAMIYAALAPGGVLGVWSAFPDEAFPRRMTQVGFETETLRVRPRTGGKRLTHVLFLGRRRG